MTKVLDNILFSTLMVMAITLVAYTLVAGITSPVVAVAIVYVALGGFYTGYKTGARARV